MTTAVAPRVELNGHPARIEEIWAVDRAGGGHFTALQVRGGRTLGLDFHLARLDAASRELFGAGLDGELVRAYIRHALGDDTPDASVRVNVFAPSPDGGPDGGGLGVVVSVRPPGAPPAAGHVLQSVTYLRRDPHIKHATGFGQSYYGDLARANGAHDALLTGPDGVIAECAVANIGFVAGDAIVWPDAPALSGVMMQVLRRELDRAGVPWRRQPVFLADLAALDGAFVTSARGLAPVARVDDRDLDAGAPLLAEAARLLARAPAQEI
jgi:branched-subunit amino acid aminotransferase/4-amino-4-deoxychorismate lyase